MMTRESYGMIYLTALSCLASALIVALALLWR
jgi:hypothetical protein